MSIEIIRPGWPAPAVVRAAVSTRGGGLSRGPWASLNLGAHVGDEAGAVGGNRRRLKDCLGLPEEPLWLDQVHGVQILQADRTPEDLRADGAAATRPGAVCALLTADCLPVLLCESRGGGVAAAHAGWRGLAAGVIESAIAAMDVPAHRLIAWLGPAIGPAAFEVGEEVLRAFVEVAGEDAVAFHRNTRGRWQADLWLLARQRLRRAGVTRVYGGGDCTYAQPRRFFSYRRDGNCGRMASLIWLDPDA